MTTAHLIFPKNLIKRSYVIAPREILNMLINNHHYYQELRGTQIPSFDVEIVGSLGEPDWGGPERILITGDLTARNGESRNWAIANNCLPSFTNEAGERISYKGDSIPLLGGGREIINELLGSDSGDTEIPILDLAKVITYSQETDATFPELGHSPYAERTIERLVLKMADGSKQVAYSHSVGYMEGYQYDLFASKKTAYKDAFDTIKARAKQDWTELECWECGAVYNEPGHVEPGQMGCDRCR
jgi:hypothetical protein